MGKTVRTLLVVMMAFACTLAVSSCSKPPEISDELLQAFRDVDYYAAKAEAGKDIDENFAYNAADALETMLAEFMKMEKSVEKVSKKSLLQKIENDLGFLVVSAQNLGSEPSEYRLQEFNKEWHKLRNDLGPFLGKHLKEKPDISE